MIREINRQLKEDFDYLVEEGYEVLGVFLFGSQNYKTCISTSDIDVKAIIIPSVSQMIFGDTETHVTIPRENGEITVYDINFMHYNFKKQNINFVEILFTKYKYVNPKYAELYETMFELREEIAHLNEFRSVHAQMGNLKNKISKLFHEVPSNKERIERYGYDNKAFSDILRYEDFMTRYIEGVSYAECLIPEKAKYLTSLKLYPTLSKEEVASIVSTTEARMKTLETEFYETHPDRSDSYLIEVIDGVTERCCKAYLKERCYFETWPLLSY